MAVYLDESIPAAYALLDWRMGKKTTAKAGLRFEYTNSTRDTKTQKNLVAAGQLHFNHPGFRLTFTHSFGNEQVRAKRNRSTGAEEEKDRLKM